MSQPPPESMRPTLLGDRWAVVGGHPLVSQVAAEVLAQGGNAIDAGVAGGLAANVVQADMCNLGGIAPILIRRAGEDAAYSVAGVGTWGASADRAAILAAYGGDLPPGGVPCIVPGALSGWITALAEFGSWSFADVSAPAADLATGGFPLDQRTARSLEIAGARFGQWESSREVFWPQDRPMREFERLVQPQLGRLLLDLAAAERGASRIEGLQAVHDRFYRGPAATTIADFVRACGGYLEASDLAGFRAEVAPAPSIEYAGWHVHVTPTWSQGLIVAQSLGILRGLDLKAMGHNSSDYLHHVVEALKLAFADRERSYGDPAFVDVDIEGLLGEEHLGRLRALIGERALPALPGVPADPTHHQPHDQPQRPLRSTTALTVVDAAGNAFSVAPSDTLDGGPIIPELGILCSHRGVQSRLQPGHPNVLEPGKRPCVTPSAVIALRDGSVAGASRPQPLDVWAMACPGADVIVQAMLQCFLNRADFAMTPQQAVEAPRLAGSSFPAGFHPHGQADRVLVEDRVPEAVRAELTARGHELGVWPGYAFDAGSVQMSLATTPERADTPVLSAGADPRRTAYALVR
jgi:gamma-glutamyltranspeptidase / glutathione hydrolase